MLGLTTLGIIHTAISLVAVGSGLVALVRDREITSKNRIGQVYIVTTVLTCLTGFGIFQHGGFNKAHALGVITLIVLAVAGLAGARSLGRLSPYLETVAYSLTFFFHLVPGFTETATRLPVGAPLAANDQAPGLQAAIGVCFLLFLIGAVLQVRRLRKASRTASTPPLAAPASAPSSP
jgi:uncharacterized membrane protein